MLQKQPFLPHFKQRGFVFKYKLMAVQQRYEAATISIIKGLFKCTLASCFALPLELKLKNDSS